MHIIFINYFHLLESNFMLRRWLSQLIIYIRTISYIESKFKPVLLFIKFQSQTRKCFDL